jgi:hypothetical protein
MMTRILITALALLIWVSFADAQTVTAGSPLPPTNNYSDFGPFATVSEDNTGPDVWVANC